MASETSEKGAGRSRRRDLIGIFVRHPTAANLLMVLMILSGVFALQRMNTQFFPDFGIDFITISVEWRGASAEDVDTNIVEAIEPEIRFLDGIKHVRSNASEGFANIYIEYHPGTDMQLALSNVETAIGQVTTLPEDSERPEVRRIVRYEPISRVILSGPFSESALKALAKRMRDDLLARGIDRGNVGGRAGRGDLGRNSAGKAARARHDARRRRAPPSGKRPRTCRRAIPPAPIRSRSAALGWRRRRAGSAGSRSRRCRPGKNCWSTTSRARPRPSTKIRRKCGGWVARRSNSMSSAP